MKFLKYFWWIVLILGISTIILVHNNKHPMVRNNLPTTMFVTGDSISVSMENTNGYRAFSTEEILKNILATAEIGAKAGYKPILTTYPPFSSEQNQTNFLDISSETNRTEFIRRWHLVYPATNSP